MVRRDVTAPGAEPAVLQAVPDSTQTVEYRTIHGYRRAFRMAGHGPAVLLIHGIGDNSSAWSDIIDMLATDHTVIAPDLLGHGLSDKPRADYSIAAYANAMRDLLSVVGIRRVTVIGHSLGGGVAMQFCYQFPEFVERLVLVSTGGVTRDVSPMLRALALPGVNAAIAGLRIPGLVPASHLAGTVGGRAVAPVARVLPRRVREHLHDAPEVMRIVDGLAEATAHAAFTRTLRAVVDWRGQVVTMLDRSYLTVRLPVMLVWGTGDTVIPHHHALLAHSAMPHSLLESFEGAGHFPHHDDPLRFVAAVRRFMASTSPMQHDTDEWSELLTIGARPDDLTGPRRVQEAVLEELASERSAT
ncbi:alpha/beta fold hydrolase [Williamsia deligens]|uniref:Alpha/beta fold hydrolase n=1 Tax=Williamsia deligens TaxID=321325 RepID=A0ABW3G4I1_9NOCA|nr:alpha/beta hydrolase [Williamsia deligens]MCP2194782.1 Pimeloyl-ACP methyl ester carboxylesterase [Williamsia deligens]